MNVVIERKRIRLGCFVMYGDNGISAVEEAEVEVLVYRATWNEIPGGQFQAQDFTDIATLDRFVREADAIIEDYQERRRASLAKA